MRRNKINLCVKIIIFVSICGLMGVLKLYYNEKNQNSEANISREESTDMNGKIETNENLIKEENFESYSKLEKCYLNLADSEQDLASKKYEMSVNLLNVKESDKETTEKLNIETYKTTDLLNLENEKHNDGIYKKENYNFEDNNYVINDNNINNLINSEEMNKLKTTNSMSCNENVETYSNINEITNSGEDRIKKYITTESSDINNDEKEVNGGKYEEKAVSNIEKTQFLHDFAQVNMKEEKNCHDKDSKSEKHLNIKNFEVVDENKEFDSEIHSSKQNSAGVKVENMKNLVQNDDIDSKNNEKTFKIPSKREMNSDNTIENENYFADKEIYTKNIDDNKLTKITFEKKEDTDFAISKSLYNEKTNEDGNSGNLGTQEFLQCIEEAVQSIERFCVSRISYDKQKNNFEIELLKQDEDVHIFKFLLQNENYIIKRCIKNEFQFDEVELLNRYRLDHENIVKIYYADYLDSKKNTAFFVLEFLPTDPYMYICNQNNAQMKILELALDISYAVKYLHDTHGTIHGDIKIDNIKGTYKNNLVKFKLIDFDTLTQINENEVIQTRMGTDGYMTPEMVLRAALTRSSDIWQIGMVIYYLEHPSSYSKYVDDQNIRKRANFKNWIQMICAESGFKDLLTQILVFNWKERPKIDNLIALIQEEMAKLNHI